MALLYSVQAAIRSGDAGAPAQLLRSMASAADAPALGRFVPAIVAVLQDEAEAGMAAAAAGASAAEEGPRGPAGRLEAVLRVVGALVENGALPVEACAEELLSLTSAVVVHRAAGAPAAAPAPAPAPAGGGPAPYQARAAARGVGGEAAALGAASAEVQLRLRALAARVLAALIGRLEGAAAAAGAGGLDMAAAVRAPLATLLLHVIAGAPHPPPPAGGAAAEGAPAQPLPAASPSVFGATLALSCVGAAVLAARVMPLAPRLAVEWGEAAEDAGRSRAERAWAQHCTAALQKVAGGAGSDSARSRS